MRKPIADILFKYKHISADPNKVDHRFRFSLLSADIFYYPRLLCKQKKELHSLIGSSTKYLLLTIRTLKLRLRIGNNIL